MSNCFVMHPQCQELTEADDNLHNLPEKDEDDEILMDPEFTMDLDEIATCAAQKAQSKAQLPHVFASDAVSQSCKDLIMTSLHLECVMVELDQIQ